MPSTNRPKAPSRRKGTEEGPTVPIVATTPETPGPSRPSRSRQAAIADPPTSEQIAERAYWIYLARGSSYGDPIADWLQAERELLDELGARKRRTRTSKG